MAIRKPNKPKPGDMIVGDSEDWSGGISITSFQESRPVPPTLFNPNSFSQSISNTTSSTNVTKREEVKVATPDIVGAVLGKAYSNEKEVETFFEDLGIQEILSVTRNTAMNIVNGQNVSYQPIQNIAILSLKYNSLNIIPMPSSENTFRNFSISLQSKLIEDGQGTGPDGATEYLENITNDLIINITNLQADELVEIESLSIERTISDTIYTGDLS